MSDHKTLDAMADAMVHAAADACKPYLELTQEDMEALNDWLQERLGSRIESRINSPLDQVELAQPESETFRVTIQKET